MASAGPEESGVKVRIPPESVLTAGRIDRRFIVALKSVAGRSLSSVEARFSVFSGGKLGEFGLAGAGDSVQGIVPRLCAGDGRMVASKASGAASDTTFLMVGKVFRTNWFLVILDSISARCRSVLSSKIEYEIVCTTSERV